MSSDASAVTLCLWVAGGVGLGTAFLGFARRGKEARRRRVLSIGLVVAAVVHVGPAAVVGDLWDRVASLVGVVLFVAVAWLGARRGRHWLAAGWAGHVLWDALLHVAAPAVAPAWYIFLCVGFDSVVAVGTLRHAYDREERATS